MKNELYFDDIYGSYRNKTYSDIFPDAQTFEDSFANSGMNSILTPEQLTDMYYILYSQYGDSPIANSNENIFKYSLMRIANSEGPIDYKRMQIQQDLILMKDEEIEKGNTMIFNTALNPSTTPTTATIDELQHINAQNVNKNKRGKIEGYQAILRLLDENLTKNFIKKFRLLFLTFVSPEGALWYETEHPNIPIEQEEM